MSHTSNLFTCHTLEITQSSLVHSSSLVLPNGKNHTYPLGGTAYIKTSNIEAIIETITILISILIMVIAIPHIFE